MINQLLVTLVNSVLGTGKKTARGNMAYNCPHCNHHKPKLEVNFTENKNGQNPWHCWVCGKKGKSIGLLLRGAGATQDVINEAKSLAKDVNHTYVEKTKATISLPDEFIGLNNVDTNDIMARHALAYIKNRHISKYDIIKYNIGYCKKGLYKNMIIIPTYDADGRLNYFTARSFEKEPYVKYRNPQVSRDIIPNEHMINWNVPLILCEGLFDAIAIKRNAIPLFGKTIPPKLLKRFVERKVKKVYLILDADAQKDSIKIVDKLKSYQIDVNMIILEDKDPSELGFEKTINLIKQTNDSISFSDMMKMKLGM